MLEQVFTLELEFLTPVHVGTGSELDPFRYVLDDGAGKARPTLRLVDFERFVADHAGDAELDRALTDKEFGDLRAFLAERLLRNPGYTLAQLPVNCPNFVKKYRAQLDARRDDHQLLVSPMPRSSATPQRAYLPGSSLKGAIRTAVGNAHVDSARVTERDAHRMAYNERTFGRIRDDVFKFLKVGDVALSVNGTQLVAPLEVSRNPDKLQAPPKNFVESTHSLGTGGEMRATTRLLLPAQRRLAGPQAVKHLDMPSLFGWLNAFYLPKYRDEMRKFYALPHLARVKAALAAVTARVEAVEKQPEAAALVRVGHFSHVECVTYDGVRQPKGRVFGGKNVYGTTRTLAGGEVPFGWVLLRVREGYAPEAPEDGEGLAVVAEAGSVSSTPPASPRELLESRLQSFTLRLKACAPAQWPGMFPGIAQGVLVQRTEEPEFVAAAARIMLNVIQDAGKTRNFKDKSWFKALQEVAGS